MADANVIFQCPSMKINRLRRGLKMTEAISMYASVWFPGDTVTVFNSVVIPETYVYNIGFLRWMVNSCVGEGTNDNGDRITVYLPPEPVIFDLLSFGIYALPITARVTLALAGGPHGTLLQGEVTFPKCRTRHPLFHPVADAVNTTGGDLTIISKQ